MKEQLYSVSFTDASTGTVVGGHGTILRTTDGGGNWNKQSATSWYLCGVCFADARTGTAVGEQGTIIRTTDGGASWFGQATGTLHTFFAVSFTDANHGTAVGVGGMIMHTTTGGGPLSVKGAEMEIPVDAMLEQNYPNPFNPSTTISYELPKASQVRLTIFDILGREVQTLVNETKQPGKYEATFNATNLASGVFLYRLQAGSFTETRRLLLLK